MNKKNYLAIFAKSFNWAGFFLPKKIHEKCSALYDFCREADNIADDENKIEIKKETLKQYQSSKSENGLRKEDKIFYLQPAWNNANGFSLAIDFVKNNPDRKLSLQTHKYLKIN